MLERIFIVCLILCFVLREPVASMRLVVQKVKSASVTVEGQVISSIGPGVMALVGLHEYDTKEDMEYCCKRLLGCKLWENDNGALWRQGVKQRGFEVNGAYDNFVKRFGMFVC
jgi:D-tyrosyl-tRNA(Tyr) deacylase